MAWESGKSLRVLAMYFSQGVKGWSERLYVFGSALDTVKTTCESLVSYRLAMLAKDCSLDYVKISTVGPPRDRHKIRFDAAETAKYTPAAVVAPAVADPGLLVCNDPENCVQVELENADGNWATRFLHGIPDSVVSSNQLTQVITPAVGVVPAIGDVTFSKDWFVIVGYYLSKIKALTVMGKRVLAGGSYNWYQDAIYACESGGLTRHKVGRPFGLARGRATPR